MLVWLAVYLRWDVTSDQGKADNGSSWSTYISWPNLWKDIFVVLVLISPWGQRRRPLLCKFLCGILKGVGRGGSMTKTQLLLAQCGRVLRGTDGLFIHLLAAGRHRSLRRRLHCCQQQGTWKYRIAAFVIKAEHVQKHSRWNPSMMAYVQDLCLKLWWASLASSSGTKAHSWL